MATDEPRVERAGRARGCWSRSAVAVVALVANWMWPTDSAAPVGAASNRGAADGSGARRAKVDPADLDVRLET